MSEHTVHRTFASAAGAMMLAASGGAWAGGLGLYEVGTADVGLASAGYSARAQDAATAFTNPAGMTRLNGTQIMLGAQALYGDLNFSPDSGTSPALGGNDGGNPLGWFPGGGLFVTHRVNSDLAIGFAATGNFGLSLEYEQNWVGRYYTQEGTLMALSLLPSIAYKVNDRLSLGASLNASYGMLKSRIAVNRAGAGPDGSLELEDEDWGFGLNLGLMYEFNNATRLGLTYTGQTKLGFEPDAQFSGAGPVLQALLQSRGLMSSKVGMGVNVPQGVDISLFHQLNPQWAVLGSLGWQDWSKFGRVDVSIDNTADPRSAVADMKTKDTWRVAIGAQYRISDPWLLNFGMAYDSKFQTAATVSPAMPANDAWRFGVGVQNQSAKDFEWGVAFEYATGGSLRVDNQGNAPVALGGRGNLSGEYDPHLYFLSANLGWKF